MPSLALCTTLVFITVIIYFLLPRVYRFLGIIFLGLILGCTITVYHADKILQWHLPTQLIKKRALVIGKIISLPKKQLFYTAFDFALQRIDGKPANSKVHLVWYGQIPSLMIGAKWQLAVRLKPAYGLHNRVGFDYQQYLFMHGIRATGNVVSHDAENVLLANSEWSDSIGRLREHLQQVISKTIQPAAIAAIIAALVTGSRDLMSQAQWQVLQNTGTNHLVAIAGLHIGFIAAAIYFLVNYLWRCFRKINVRYPAQRAAAIAAWLVALSYSALAGFSLPTQRAILMMTALLFGQLLNIAFPMPQRLALACLLVLMMMPMQVYTASFWLSFAAIAWIGFVLGGRLQNHHGLKSFFSMQTAIFLGLLPITLYFFQAVSLIVFPANMLAIPWIGILVMPLALITCVIYSISPVLGMQLFWLTGKLLAPLWWYLQQLATLPHAMFWQALSNPWVLITTLVAITWLLLPRGWPVRGLGLVWMLPLVLWHPASPPQGGVKLTVLDVGQGLSAVIQTHQHVLVFDTGPSSMTGEDAGKSVLVPYLLSQTIHRVDRLIVSHGDNDHIGGAPSLLRILPVESIYTSVPNKFNSKVASACYAGQQWRWDNVVFTMLSPARGAPYLDNNSSCVLRVVAGDKAILLTGDIQAETERYLLSHYSDIAATILQAPHHGSKTSSTPAFIHAVAPAYVVFAVGHYNRYRLPSALVVQRYQKQQVKLLSTATDGAVSFLLIPQQPVTVRRSYMHNRYWQQ